MAVECNIYGCNCYSIEAYDLRNAICQTLNMCSIRRKSIFFVSKCLFGTCANWNAFFLTLSLPFPPFLYFPLNTSYCPLLKKCVFILPSSFFPSPLVSFKFGIRVCLRMSVTNCSQTLWQCFSFPPVPFLWPSYFFFSFFLFFPSRSGAPDVKEPRYGASPVSFSFSFSIPPLCT